VLRYWWAEANLLLGVRSPCLAHQWGPKYVVHLLSCSVWRLASNMFACVPELEAWEGY
jgi:hypothetical protein